MNLAAILVLEILTGLIAALVAYRCGVADERARWRKAKPEKAEK